MNIDLDILKSALIRVIDDHIALHGNRIVALDEDLYWIILDDQLFNLSEQPHDLAVGNLEDEFSGILRHMTENEPLGAVEMQHLAAVLTWLSAKAGSVS